MRSLAILAGASALAVVVCSCADQRSAGNTTQTENTVAARVILVDTILPYWNRPESAATVATLRLDSFNFPEFDQTDSSARDLAVETVDESPIPFDVDFWDKKARLGRLHVRLDTNLVRPNSKFVLRWKQPLLSLANYDAVWKELPDSQKLELSSVLVSDFENHSATTLLPTAPSWSTYTGDSANVTPPDFLPSGRSDLGTALTIEYIIEGRNSYVVLKTPLTIDKKPKNLRSMDSLVFWAKGTKNANMFIAFDHKDLFKAWKLDTLDTVWTRIRITPADFIPASISSGGNKGWNAVRDSVTDLSFIPTTGSRIWLDDIRLYGIDRDDLR